MANENLTEERINWLIDYFSSDAVSLYAGIDVVQVLREVQQRRKADGEPMGFIWKNERGEDVAVLGAPPAAWNKFSTRLLYAAPQPAPVVLEELLAAMEDVLRISDRDHDAWSRAKLAIGDCRAAMLQQSSNPMQLEPASQHYKLPNTLFKPVADLYEMQFEDGHPVVWHYDPEKAVQWLATCTGNKVIEYVKLERLQAAITGYSPEIPEDWMLVPKEPTREMVQTVADEVHPAVFVRAVYKTMIAAAPRFISFTCSIK